MNEQLFKQDMSGISYKSVSTGNSMNANVIKDLHLHQTLAEYSLKEF